MAKPESRNTESDSGRSIIAHKELGITVHLFVRAKPKMADGRGAPFYYCGPVEFLSWSGDKPITVVWRLSAAVPGPLWEELGMPLLEGNNKGNLAHRHFVNLKVVRTS